MEYKVGAVISDISVIKSQKESIFYQQAESPIEIQAGHYVETAGQMSAFISVIASIWACFPRSVWGYSLHALGRTS